SAFGMYLHSNCPIPGLVPSINIQEADLQIWLDLMPPWLNQTGLPASQKWYVSDSKSQDGLPVLTVEQLVDGAYLQLTYYDRTKFIINQAGTEIWATWPDTLTLEDTATYLLGPILGFVLRRRGVVCLHASAVAIGDESIAIVGAAGAGKSTTAAAFAKAGFPVLSDDVLPLWDQKQKFLVQPAYPRVRLWPSSVIALYGEVDALPCLTPNWDKRYLDLTKDGYEFQQQALPLGGIYILGDRTTSPAAPFLEALPSHSGLISLISNTYANNLLDKKMRAAEFDLLSRVVAKVPLRRVTPHTDSERISKLCDVILEDFQKLGNQ
ncbi:MAG TPA: hypothetical protein VIQ31_29620, partial [Phormidium sp.]